MSKTTPSQALRFAKLSANPTCSKCGKRKTVGDFPPRAVDYWCYSCRGEYALKAYHKKRAALSAKQLQKLRDEVNDRQTQRRVAKLAAMPAKQLAAYRRQINAENRARRIEVKDRAFAGYGGYKCACCGESETQFLTIDHVNNDGAEHKRKWNLRTGEEVYRWLIKHDFPSGFQVLCMNCNWGKRYNNGVCPHKAGKV